MFLLWEMFVVAFLPLKNFFLPPPYFMMLIFRMRLSHEAHIHHGTPAKRKNRYRISAAFSTLS